MRRRSGPARQLADRWRPHREVCRLIPAAAIPSSFRPSILSISHDLAVIRQMCDRVAVMKVGESVEMADTETQFSAPQLAYTRELLRLAPSLDRIFSNEPVAASV
ncbi:hypothetical protein AB4048_13655 [Rhizobium sp. RAF56]|jgi:ABC-type dipeptide/oligopeptide/nickel transport system ATPase component